MTPYEVGLLTPYEFKVMLEEWNKLQQNQAELQRNVILNAIVNANRKKNTKVIDLFEKKSIKKSREEIKIEREELFSENPFAR